MMKTRSNRPTHAGVRQMPVGEVIAHLDEATAPKESAAPASESAKGRSTPSMPNAPRQSPSIPPSDTLVGEDGRGSKATPVEAKPAAVSEPALEQKRTQPSSLIPSRATGERKEEAVPMS